MMLLAYTRVLVLIHERMTVPVESNITHIEGGLFVLIKNKGVLGGYSLTFSFYRHSETATISKFRILC